MVDVSSGRLEMCVFFFQAEDGIRYLVRSRGLGDVYKRQGDDNLRIYRGHAELGRYGSRGRYADHHVDGDPERRRRAGDDCHQHRPTRQRRAGSGAERRCNRGRAGIVTVAVIALHDLRLAAPTGSGHPDRRPAEQRQYL
mgnify:CR=1 FL=1